MLIVHVHIHVRPESVQAFREATIENARNSIQEPGIARFDVVQQTDDPTRFVLAEAYRDEAATRAHKETPHYAKWRDTVAPAMAETRTGLKFTNLFPAEKDWYMPFEFATAGRIVFAPGTFGESGKMAR